MRHRHRHRRLAAAGQRRGAHARHAWRGELRGAGPRGRGVRARPLPHPALPDLSRDPPGAVPGRRDRRAASTRYRARRHPYRDRRAARLGGARASACERGLPFTTGFHTRFPEYVAARASGCRWPGATPSLRRFHAPAPRRPGGDAVDRRASSTRAASATCVPWSRGVDLDAVPARARDATLDAAAADLPLCRAGRGREEHRGLPRPRPARHQGGGRRRAGAGVAGAASSPTRTSSAPAHGEDWRALCRRRRVRLPQPHRHVRPGDARGAGLRRAGRGLPGAPRRSTSSPMRRSARSTRTCAGVPCGARLFA